MLRILGRGPRLCDGLSPPCALCVGGLSLFGSLTLPRFLQAREAQSAPRAGRAKSVVLLNLLGGPPHQDTFDLKPFPPTRSERVSPDRHVAPGSADLRIVAAVRSAHGSSFADPYVLAQIQQPQSVQRLHRLRRR